MSDNKKPHIKIGVIGHAGYSRADLDSAIRKVLSGKKDINQFASIDEIPNLKKADVIFDDKSPFEELENE